MLAGRLVARGIWRSLAFVVLSSSAMSCSMLFNRCAWEIDHPKNQPLPEFPVSSAITYEAYECVEAERFPVVRATIAGETQGRAVVHIKFPNDWRVHMIEMVRDGDSYVATLPRFALQPGSLAYAIVFDRREQSFRGPVVKVTVSTRERGCPQNGRWTPSGDVPSSPVHILQHGGDPVCGFEKK